MESFLNASVRTPTTPSGRYSHNPYSLPHTPHSSRNHSHHSLDQLLHHAVATTLPPPVAAPLAAMVYLTKSAGEQNLGRVTHMAASMYYFQLIQAGVIRRPPPPAAAGEFYPPSTANTPYYQQTTSPLMPGFPLPPMDTFSFSSLLTNVPILSFVYEMKCRWGHLGVLKDTPTGVRQGRGYHMMGNHSTGGLSLVDRTVGQNVTNEMEMWITRDQMLHGRISRDLAERLCWSLAERPEVMAERVTQLPSVEEGYWHYRGLVDRRRPPPLPPTATISPKDVYVMGAEVLPGFNEGDLLCYDPTLGVWYSEYSIPLEGVVLAAMRPHCKAAREADPADPRWVTTFVHEEEYQHRRESLLGGDASLEGLPLPPITPAQEAELARLNAIEPNVWRRIHEHVGNFFVFSFEKDGVVYHHGTVPNFANPNKKKNAEKTTGKEASVVTPLNTAALPVQEVPSGSGMSPSKAADSSPTTNKEKERPGARVPTSIANTLFSLLPIQGKGNKSGGEVTMTIFPIPRRPATRVIIIIIQQRTQLPVPP
ncbi:hypothetical protein AGDE_16606 [Angomonas deanei]|uniref:Uncharacterized protein n=1 Tax=Angomonas deanei TaxID=59799 RepID=A0A7G2C2G1_9TRYP|nr:hypothetical protein AGDE_16606 [Angomonas deanei]CAD2213836.1 hypothetical protein, conserved [Angomonas deanei]|eukprot:EPY16791.1 hypothetical protein AGDE_16606 [Angomonas deanei]